MKKKGRNIANWIYLLIKLKIKLASNLSILNQESHRISYDVNSYYWHYCYDLQTNNNLQIRAEPRIKFCRVSSFWGRFCRIPSTDIEYLTKYKYF